jgi:bis(5'-nucleosyl)-tetraphosphatase (symmetrical)
MIYLLGDLQGCDTALAQMLGELAFSPSRDRLVVLGDMVNRGPGSLAVLKRLSGLGADAICLLGNHDLHLLAVAAGIRNERRGDTIDDILSATDCAHWLHWLREQPLAHVEAGWLCVHAGVVPQWDAARALALASEVQDMLRGDAHTSLLGTMYGDEPRRWSDDLQGPERWRFVVNTLTRIRFCAADGTLDLETKEGAGAARPGYWPWFEVPGRATATQPVAFGHWSALGLVNRPDVLALDTGCVWGGALTAVRVDGGRREVHQVSCGANRRVRT